jgi:hypothetical protein
VESGIDFINAKIEQGQFFVADSCTGILSEIWDYYRDEAGKIVKVNDHFMDALRVCGILRCPARGHTRMKPFSFFLNYTKTTDNRPELDGIRENLPFYDNFSNFYNEPRTGDSYLYNAWVNIAVNILIRNIARADFTIKKGGEDVTSGPLYALFRRPNSTLSRFDLWKETAAWWHFEGEAFWWFGPDYTGGLPKELYVLNPRRIRHEEYNRWEMSMGIAHKKRRWFYHAGSELIPILSDELIRFREWNSWCSVRGCNAFISLELEQDYYANKAKSQLLKNNAIPQRVVWYRPKNMIATFGKGYDIP